MEVARLHRIGTIFSRVTGLINKKVLKPEEIPLWYEVYASFPPKYEPEFNRPAPDIKVREIFYPEDATRAKIHAKYKNKLGVINLNSSAVTNSQKWLALCSDYISQGISEEEALKKLNDVHEQPKQRIEIQFDSLK